MSPRDGVGGLLRAWRRARRWSQEQLALEAEISSRHLSCVETGRAQPSREMVLRLATVLDVPLRERNSLLASAGFAPVYRETDLDAPEMAPVRRAVDFLLERHEPYGAVVIDSGWNLWRANQGAMRLFATFLPAPPSDEPVNLLRALFEPQGLRQTVENWPEVARASLVRARWEAAAQGPGGPAGRVLAQIEASAEIPEDVYRVEPMGALPLVVPVRLRKGGLRVEFFTTITTLGTPADVTAQELRIETWFPADDASEAWWRS